LIDLSTFFLLSGLLIVYTALIFIDAAIRNRSLKIGFLSVIAMFVQLIGYGVGFIRAFVNKIILKR
jgi:hypothetical protein